MVNGTDDDDNQPEFPFYRERGTEEGGKSDH